MRSCIAIVTLLTLTTLLTQPGSSHGLVGNLLSSYTNPPREGGVNKGVDTEVGGTGATDEESTEPMVSGDGSEDADSPVARRMLGANRKNSRERQRATEAAERVQRELELGNQLPMFSVKEVVDPTKSETVVAMRVWMNCLFLLATTLLLASIVALLSWFVTKVVPVTLHKFVKSKEE